jgi:hypothetical protein
VISALNNKETVENNINSIKKQLATFDLNKEAICWLDIIYMAFDFLNK